MLTLCFSDYGSFILNVTDIDEISVVELDSGNSTNVSACVTAYVNEPFHRDAAIFQYLFSSNSTATLVTDFGNPNFTAEYAVVPAGFSGEYRSCVSITVFGDDTIEDDETVVYELRQLSELDRLVFATNRTAVTIHILNNDG